MLVESLVSCISDNVNGLIIDLIRTTMAEVSAECCTVLYVWRLSGYGAQEEGLKRE